MLRRRDVNDDTMTREQSVLLTFCGGDSLSSPRGSVPALMFSA